MHHPKIIINMAAFKIVKSTDWKSSTGSTGTTLVLAASGRVVTANVGDFETGLKIKDNVCTITVPFVVTKDQYIATTGETKVGFRLKPKVDWEFSEF